MRLYINYVEGERMRLEMRAWSIQAMGRHVLVRGMDVTGNTECCGTNATRRRCPATYARRESGKERKQPGDADNTIKKLLTFLRSVSEQVHQVAPLPAA